MKRKTLLKPLLLITIFTVFSNGQTHIKDLIEITPKQNVPYYQLMKQDTAKFVPFRYDESMGKELIEERTLYRKVFLQPDGTKKARIYASPIHFEDENGNIQDMKSYNYLDNGELQNRYLMIIYNDIYNEDQIMLDASCLGTIGSKYVWYSGNTIPTYKIEKSRSLIKFPIEQIPTNANIINVDFVFNFRRLTKHYCLTEPCPTIDNTGRDMAINIVLSEWGFSETTGIGFTSWDGWGQFELDFKSNYEDFIHLDDSMEKTIQSLNVTEAVKNWTDGTYANNGFLLSVIDEETVSSSVIIGCWAGHGTVGKDYFLDVTYADIPVEPKLKIIEPTSTSSDECILPYLDENLPPDQIYPVMPQVTCKAVFDGLSSLTNDTVDINWEYIVEYDYKWRDIITGVTSTITSLDTIKGTTQISGSDTTAWLVNFADKFLGGTVTIIAKANVNGTVYADTLLNVYEIRGTNPKQNIVRDFIAYQNPGLMYELWAIFYYESDRKFAQFEGVNTNLLGYPLFGPPTGYGICQLDPVTDGRETAELWNWEVNVNSGIDRFLNKKTKFLDNNKYQNQIINGKDYYLEDHKWEWKDRTVGPLAPTPFTNRELMIDWMQLYNGGHYFYWVPIDKLVHNGPGHWEIHYNKIKKNMSIGVGEIYYNKSEQFRQGIFPSPSIWNNYLQGCQ